MRKPRKKLKALADVLACVVKDSNGCWNWPYGTSKGYGAAFVDGKQVTVHKFVCEELSEPAPEGFDWDHECENKRCCNPDHVQLKSHKDNVLLGSGSPAKNAAKVVCLRGHSLEGDNLYIPKNGSRQCRECRRIRKSKNPGGKSAQVHN